MKAILTYGQACRRYRLGKADGWECLQRAADAARAGYNVRAFETVSTISGMRVLHKKKGYQWGKVNG